MRCVDALREQLASEYCHCDVSSLALDPLLMAQMAKKTAGSIGLFHHTGGGGFQISRRQVHVREDTCNNIIIWIVEKGRFDCHQGANRTSFDKHNIGFSLSAVPSVYESWPDEDGNFAALVAVVPFHLFLEVFQSVDELKRSPLRREIPEAKAACDILTELFRHSDSLPSTVAQDLGMVAIRALKVGFEAKIRYEKVILKKKRNSLDLKDVLFFIDSHLCESNLNGKEISQGLGVSERHVHNILSSGGTSLHEQIWGRRVDQAYRMLKNSSPDKMKVSDICYSLGFKNASHFSRIFAKRFGVNPRDILKNSRVC